MALSILYVIIALLVAWIVLSVPLYLAAKLIAGRKATFGKAMLASLVGPIIEYISLFVFLIILAPFAGAFAVPIAVIIAVIILIYVYASIFDTSWLGGLGIAIVSFIVSFIIIAIFSAFFAVLPFGTSFFHGFGPGMGGV